MEYSLHDDNDSLELNEDVGFGDEHQGGLLQPPQSPTQNELDSGTESTSHSTFKGSNPPEPVTWKGPSRLAFLWDVLSLVLSVALITLGGLVAALRGQTKTEASERVIEFAGLITTLWPILFAAIIGNAIKAYANYKVERGVPLLSLEQLMGSLTIGGTVVTAFTFSKVLFQPSTLLLIILWSFSPLGSQAIYRATFLKPAEATGILEIQLYTPDRMTQLVASEFGLGDGHKTQMIALFQSALYAVNSGVQYCNGSCDGFQQLAERLGGAATAGAATAVDPWGNIRIPTLRSAPGYNTSSPDEWIMTPYTQYVQNYSSLLGVRIQGINPGFQGQAQFTIPASYDELNCLPWTDVDLLNQTSVNTWMSDKYKSFVYTYNASLDKPPYVEAIEDLWKSGYPNVFIDYADVQGNDSRLSTSPDWLIFGSLDHDNRVSGSAILHYTECSISPLYLDANVTCNSTESGMHCGVEAVRRMPQTPGLLNMTMFNSNFYGVGYNMVYEFPEIIGVPPNSGSSTSIEMYLQNPTQVFVSGAGLGGGLGIYANVSAAPLELFQERLGLVMNTIFQSSVHVQAYFGQPLQYNTPSDALLNVSASTTTPLPPVYELRRLWITIYFVAAIIMFLATVFATILRWRCSAPQLLGYVSSLVRDSTHFTEAGLAGKSTESGPEIATRLSGVRVRVVDVKADENIGRIAFAPASEGKRVRAGRWYE